MEWLEKNQETHKINNADSERAALLEKVKKESFPVINKEVGTGKKPFDPLDFQPVQSPGFFSSEFASKGKDLIFHFWPFGYQAAERSKKALPRFPKTFLPVLKTIFETQFDINRLEFNDDKDVGAICIIAKGWGDNHFARELAIKALTNLHIALGGEI